jgi:hypothetical protein
MPTIEAQATQLEAEVLARVEASIDRALTPAVLSKLAFKGLTPTMARTYLRARAYQAVEQELRALGGAHA